MERDERLIGNRNNGIDLMKALAIVLVVLGHSIQYTVVDFDKNALFRVIYSFHMPLFMFISGFLAYKAKLRNDYIKKRFCSLAIPFMAWLVIYGLFYMRRKIAEGDPLSVVRFILEAIPYPDHGGLWFLWVLFLISVIYFFSQKTKHKYVIMLSVILVLYVLDKILKIPLLFGFQLVQWHLFFFAMGLFFNEYGVIGRIPRFAVMLLIPFLLISEIAWSRVGSSTFGVSMGPRYYMVYNLINSYVVAILSIIVITKASTLFTRQVKSIRFLSENTLAIYSSHYLILFTFIALVNHILQEGFLKTMAVFAVTLSISIAVVIALRRIPLLNKVLYGKWIESKSVD